MHTESHFYKRLAENMSDLVALHRPDGRYIWVSPSVRRILGYSPEELIGADPYDFFHPDDAEKIRRRTHQPAISGDGNIRIRYRIRRSDGTFIWFETFTQPIENEEGEVIQLQTTSRDVTEQLHTEQALADSEALYRVAVDSLEEGLIVYDSECRVITCNRQATEILGLSDDELKRRVPRSPEWDAMYPDGTYFPQEKYPIMVTLRSGEPCNHVVMGVYSPRWRTRRWISINSRPITADMSQHDSSAAVVASLTDVTDTIQREKQLQRWSAVFRSNDEAIILADATGIISDVNDAFLRVIRDEKASWIGRPVDDMTRDSRSDGVFASTIWPILENRANWRGELWLRDSKGGVHATWASITKIKNSTIPRPHYTIILNDFNERSERDEKLLFDAGHDALTGLPNRLLLEDRFSVAIKRAERERSKFACFYLDLDGFKPVNDNYGHAVGDCVLQHVARKILAVVRPSDTVSRIGGDEFFVIVFGSDKNSQFKMLADRICTALSETLDLEGRKLNVSASIGIAIYPDHGESPEALMEASDAAMYRAKQRKRSVAFAAPKNEAL